MHRCQCNRDARERVLLGKAKEAFDENGNLIAEGTRQF